MEVAENIEKEIEAIKAVLKALEPLPTDARSNVLEYVHKSLKIDFLVQRAPISVTAPLGAGAALGAESTVAREAPPAASIHIKQLKEQKNPRSANEMAALVAYYLANVAPQRKETITTKDVETYFKIADFPLPKKVQFTLPNAKAAGYLDAVGNGEYKLNAVGYNLVVHSMPRSGDARVRRRRKAARKKQRRAK